MSPVTITAGDFTVDADLLAAAFGLDQAAVKAKMQAGEITSLCEAGMDTDAGRFRLSFRHQTRVLKLILDTDGAVLSKSMEITGRPKRPYMLGSPDWVPPVRAG
ncbi:DUF6522 family protein [Maricaulis sp.]|uniref:DUF6522 family protein n=1 Tax=Maricaulis sp. TaxID=1486257 RepID=UPI003A9489C6